MAKAQPWLADLPDEWIPQPPTTTHLKAGDAALTNPGTNALPTLGHGTARRSLAQLGSSAQNSRRPSKSEQPSKYFDTVQSVDSVVRYDTVERQSSPKKQEGTPTWRKRLVEGELGYGDQTDLFGPSALENIFSPIKKTSVSKMPSRLQHCDNMPSSPPPWPLRSSVANKPRECAIIHGSLASNARDGDTEEASATIEASQVDDSRWSADSVTKASASTRTNQTAFMRRTVSGDTDVSDETFSPVYISKHTNIDGEVGYAAMDSETARMIRSTMTKQAEAGKGSSNVFDEDAAVIQTSLPQLEVTPSYNIHSDSLVQELGGFITTTRGGLSNYGSFKTRPLSPSDPQSRQASVALPLTRIHDFATRETDSTNNTPRTPSRSTHYPTDSPSPVRDSSKPKSSKSPLKLFSAHDTFTSRHLLRRLSELEISGSSKTEADSTLTDHLQGRQALRNSDCQPSLLNQSVACQNRLREFGDDQVDEDDFEAGIVFPSDEPSQELVGDSRDGSPEPSVLPPGARSPPNFHSELVENLHPQNGIKRKLSDRSTARSGRTDPGRSLDGPNVPGKDSRYESVRARTSPIKAPTPKRQRTLHALDLELDRGDHGRVLLEDNYEDYETDSIPTAVVLGGKPKSSTSSIQFDPRPRNPTPNQQRLTDQESSGPSISSSSPRLQAIRNKIEESDLPGSIKLVSQAKAVANEVATFTLNVTRDGDTGDRKRSITTQDFLDEAMHIMSLIRARGRPNSGLGSVEESNEESAIEQPSLMPEKDNLSMLRVSRPPSREGSLPAWRPRSQPQRDARVTSQLRRFQEQDDLEVFDQTVHSLHFRGPSEQLEYSEMEDGSLDSVRITGPLQPEQEHGVGKVANENHDSVKSQDSGGYSTGRTQGTNSTRKSDNVATLAPDAVAHLIPEEVAGMTFDRTLNKWIRSRSDKHGDPVESESQPFSNIASDDDPFGQIPDLTVDEAEEMQQFHSGRGQVNEENQLTQMGSHARNSSQQDQSTTFARPNDYHRFPSAMKSSVVKDQSNFGASEQTRATSWATDQVTKATQEEKFLERSEVSDLFSSDCGSSQAIERPAQAQGESQPDHVDLTENDDKGESDVEELPSISARQKSSRKVSFQAQTFTQRSCRPNIDQSELSIIAELPDKRVMSVSFAVSRPRDQGEDQLALTDHDPTHLLSDLPDFSVAEVDNIVGPTEQLLAATVAHHGLEVQGDRFALAVQDLVKTLTDVKGEEPFWEDIKQLDLQKRGLDSLHGLGDFCQRLQQLDISGNSIAHFEGTPAAIRQLNASHNSLSDLTAWHHLMNLQSLDISHNDISTLQGLGCLVHLRVLNASHNHINSLDGVANIEGLMKLDVSHNNISTATFKRCAWAQLEFLNISSNGLKAVGSFDHLPALEHLRLDDNLLTQLELVSRRAPQSRLKYLSVSTNQISALDLTSVTSLVYLDVDGNSICTLQGLENLEKLDTISARQQKEGSTDPTVWNVVLGKKIHARRVFLSGNALPDDLSIGHAQNTVAQLELASCGILTLPKSFGLSWPNVSRLNLNFNALKDIRPLLNMTCLTQLNLAGNRLSRLRKCVETLACLPQVKQLDLRDNPVSLGFYPALATMGRETSLARRRGPETKDPLQIVDGSIEEVQRSKSAKHLLPPIASGEDEGHRKLMDDDTRIRRRVHEILIASSAPALVTLDGLKMDRTAVLRRDDAWKRLRELGVLKPRVTT